MSVADRLRKSSWILVTIGSLVSLVTPVAARGDERRPRIGFILGGSLLSGDEYTSMGRSSHSATIGASLLVGTTLDLPIWGPDSRLSVELAYGPFRRDTSGGCFTAERPLRLVCSTSRATAGAAMAGVQIGHTIGRGTVRPWVAAGTGVTLTWFKPPEFEPVDPTTSQTFHLAGGFATRRLRLELRALVVFHHPHPHPYPDSGDTRKALQVGLTVFPFGRGQ